MDTPITDKPEAAYAPPHYLQLNIEPMHYAMMNDLNPLQANVIKYVSRYPFKNGLEDLHKAARCLEMLIQWEQDDPNWHVMEGASK